MGLSKDQGPLLGALVSGIKIITDLSLFWGSQFLETPISALQKDVYGSNPLEAAWDQPEAQEFSHGQHSL